MESTQKETLTKIINLTKKYKNHEAAFHTSKARYDFAGDQVFLRRPDLQREGYNVGDMLTALFHQDDHDFVKKAFADLMRHASQCLEFANKYAQPNLERR